MHRRGFLKSTGAAAAALSIPVGALARSPETRWQLLRARAEEPGAALVSLSHSRLPACAAATLVVELGAFQPASGGAVCDRFELETVYAAERTEARFLAARYVADSILPGTSQPTRFVAGRASLRRFDLGYRAGGASCREHCELTGLQASLLAPGTYLLVGPDRSGRPVDVEGLRLGADPLGAPDCIGERGFDCVAIRMGLPA